MSAREALHNTSGEKSPWGLFTHTNKTANENNLSRVSYWTTIYRDVLIRHPKLSIFVVQSRRRFSSSIKGTYRRKEATFTTKSVKIAYRPNIGLSRSDA